MTGRAFDLRVCQRNWPFWRVLRGVARRQRARICLVNEGIAGINLPVSIPRLLREEAEQVGAAVPPAQGRQAPVSGEGRDHRVMRVERIVLLPPQTLGHRAADEEAVDAVYVGVVPALVEGEQDQGVFHEVFIIQQLGEEAASPGACEGDIGVVAVVGHVGGDEHVLRKFVVVEVIVEHVEVLNAAAPVVVVGDRVEEDQRVVFADVVIRAGLGVFLPLESGRRHALHVLAPGDVLGVEQVGDGRDVCGDGVDVVVVHAEGVAAGGGAVVWFGWVGDGPVVVQQKAFLG